MTDFSIPEYVKALDPYKPGNQRQAIKLRENVSEVFSLASNENPLGTSQRVIDTIAEVSKNLGIYPDPASSELVNLIAQKFNKKPSQIVCGHGSESLIAHIVNAFSDINTRVLTSMGTFAGIYVKTNKIGRKLNRVPLKDWGYDLEALLRRIHSNTRIIYISNPNNPTGSMIYKDEFEWFIQQVPENIVVVLDEAYSVYGAQHEGYVDGLSYDLPNLIVLHTLSKTHGLAGLRVGYAIGPENLIDILYKVKLPFEPSLIAQKAAVAALNDYDFLTETIRINKIGIDMLINTFLKLEIEFIYPRANFIMILLSSDEFVEEFVRHSNEHGVAIRNCRPFGISRGIRISTGTPEQTEYACHVFEHVYNEIKDKYKL
ncbi:MAG: aminotransferase class I/II-fold pyridoxal phosphate-dependent enzyme [Candidatus Kapabacteria bacterium]|nr:aminotransferase class I/II-fold pyridoxal phosphate-dependent enzyme [Ignavibacteriota bacterium]MCW5883915.1 aminotransferase class I/II-fold pyridoxal phosphate-dependent enzyme [Candidatus Kapabacteria bacterium]